MKEIIIKHIPKKPSKYFHKLGKLSIFSFPFPMEGLEITNLTDEDIYINFKQ